MTMNQWIEGDVSVNGLPIHFYRTCGTGKPTLLLAHGFSDNGLCWGLWWMRGIMDNLGGVFAHQMI